MDLTRRIIDGAGQLAVRQAAGIALSFANLLVLTRLIGPAHYGMFAGSLGIFTFVIVVSQLGLNVYLIRRAGDPTEDEYHQAFSLYLAIGGAVALLGFAAAPLVERWTAIPDFGPVVAAMLAMTPFALCALVPQARLERTLDYRTIARIDVLVQVITIAVATPLAALGYGVWAPVSAWILGQLTGATLYYVVPRYRPRLLLRREVVRPMVLYGIRYSSQGLIAQLRLLINPLIVGRFAGAEAVGIVALTVRLIEMLGFMQTAGWRLSIAVFGTLRNDPAATHRRMKQAMLAQAALVGLPLVAFSVVGTVIVRLLFGERWAGVLEIFPFLAFVYLAGTVFGPPMALLQVRGLNRELIAVTVVAVAMVFASNFVLVPQHGILGYAWSEFAGLVTCLVLPFAFRRRLGVWAVGPALCFALGIGATLFWREIGWFAVLGLAVALSVREVREELIDLLRILRTRVGWSS